MKTVRVKNGTVMEIIPEYALPADKWYGDSRYCRILKGVHST